MIVILVEHTRMCWGGALHLDLGVIVTLVDQCVFYDVVGFSTNGSSGTCCIV